MGSRGNRTSRGEADVAVIIAHPGYFAFDRRPGDNPWLDLVRAVAIILVLARHGHRAFAAPEPEEIGIFDALLLNGWIGVDLFFVLSGYLISRHLIRDGLGTGRFQLRRYLSGRALRILPAYLAVLFLILASAFPLYDAGEVDLGWRVAYHLLLLQDYLPSDINIVFWSLGVEEKFYLLAPAFVWLLLTRRTRRGALLVLGCVFALSPALRAATYLGMGAPAEYPEFFSAFRSPFHASLEPLTVGVALALAQSRGWLPLSPRIGGAALLLSAVALALWLSSHEFMQAIGIFDVVAQPSLIACLCGLMTFGAVQLDKVRMINELPVRIVARLSYCLYLVHFPLLPLAIALAQQSDHPTSAFWLIYLAVTAIAAALLHYGIEKPCLLLKDRLTAPSRRASGPAASPA